ncbi:MAG: hypothetical protein LBH26_07280 [Treponema sp.]|jgi:hypothetical protein|nr:hypothetical protein [Treponema sp.]
MKYFDRREITFFPLSQRKNKADIKRDQADPAADIPVPPELAEAVRLMAGEILRARQSGRSVIVAFGAHTIKNGLGPLLGELVKRRWVSHLATNGAGVIHDWEFAFQGQSSEDVRENVREGKFGIWEETGFNINLALAVGAYRGMGYGESVGAFIVNQGLDLPSPEELRGLAASPFGETPLWKRAAAADLLDVLEKIDLPPGRYDVEHPFRDYSIQAAAYRAGLPFTSHPMFGHDIIYTHWANHGAAVGRAAERDFLSYAESVANLEGGVYISVGSAVMSPMIFEKSLSMARNRARRKGGDIRGCHIYVVDLQKAQWDWEAGEPPPDNPAYYLRFMKTFNRMGCPLKYLSADNRIFFLSLYRALTALGKAEPAARP